ncbi:MAG: copper resistance protein NlpE N-terminal domain-containing protein [Tannerella sp.]|jgi:heat shock protein HslJ|nr:copper resistance protein NlpE N-terminal domain-containing protein [Tannerella sp.]
MKNKLFICGLFALMIGMVSCKSQRKDTKSAGGVPAAIADNSQNVLDWDGFYSGFLPCADCMGIRVSLELSEDRTFNLRLVYVGKDDGSFDSFGKISWDKERNCITIGEGEDKMQFLIGENLLTALDREGNKITGELAENYILVKVDLNLVEKYWKLTDFSGEPAVTPEGGKEAHIMLKKEDCRVSGSGGCNSFTGAYTLKPNNGIIFSQMASTMKMCLNMDTETKLKQTLEATDGYTLDGDILILMAGADSLARFEAVYR